MKIGNQEINTNILLTFDIFDLQNLHHVHVVANLDVWVWVRRSVWSNFLHTFQLHLYTDPQTRAKSFQKNPVPGGGPQLTSIVDIRVGHGWLTLQNASSVKRMSPKVSAQ